MKIYISGASGKLGKSVMAALKDIPDVIPLARNAHGLKNEIITDFSEASLKKILADADVFLHLAGSVETYDPKKLREVNVELTRRIVNSLPDSCKLVFASSTSVYGKKPEYLPVTEQTPLHPDSDYSRSKYDAEQLVAAHKNSVILRISTIYGPQFQDYFTILSMLERKKMRIIGNGFNRLPFVHVDDVALAIVRSISAGAGYYLLAGQPLTQNEVFQIACTALGSPQPAKKISFSSAIFFAKINEIASKLKNKKPKMSVEHIFVLGSDRIFDCSRAKKDLDFSPRSLQSGIEEIVRAYKTALGRL